MSSSLPTSQRAGARSSRSGPPRLVLIVVVSAWVVAVAAQVAAALWGTADSATVPSATGVEPTDPPPGCGGEPCRVVASTVVNGMPVELLTDSSGRTGKLRAGGPALGTTTLSGLTEEGVRLNHDSLRCASTATPVCLVRGTRDGGMAGEVHVWRGDDWNSDGRSFFSEAGVVALDDVVGSALPEVLVVRDACAPEGTGASDGLTVGRDADCDTPAVLAEVRTLDGERAGCTRPLSSPAELTGWPDVDLSETELGDCPREVAAP